MNLINVLGLKVNPDQPIHYLIGVATHNGPRNKKRGQLYLKYGPIIFTNEDVQNLKFALEAQKMEFPKTSMKDALDTFEVSSLVGSISSMKMSCVVNMCSLHHFASDEAFSDDFFEDLVERANKDKGIYRYLMEAEVRT